MSNPRWLTWGQRLQALAQNGLAYATDPFDIERYQAVNTLAAEIVSSNSSTDFEFVRDLFHSQAGYATPKVDVRGVIFQDGKILLVRELSDGNWTLPGGWADVDETPAEAAAREVREESGYNVHVTKLLAVYDRNRHGHPPYIFHLYKLFFQCQVIGVGERSTTETGECAFFGKNEIPTLSLPRTTPDEIERMFRHYEIPGLSTDFD